MVHASSSRMRHALKQLFCKIFPSWHLIYFGFISKDIEWSRIKVKNKKNFTFRWSVDILYNSHILQVKSWIPKRIWQFLIHSAPNVLWNNCRFICEYIIYIYILAHSREMVISSNVVIIPSNLIITAGFPSIIITVRICDIVEKLRRVSIHILGIMISGPRIRKIPHWTMAESRAACCHV